MEKKSNCGIDCPCKECQKIRDLLLGKECDGKIEIIGTEKDKRKLVV